MRWQGKGKNGPVHTNMLYALLLWGGGGNEVARAIAWGGPTTPLAPPPVDPPLLKL